MALSNIVKASPTNVNTCVQHKDGNGRDCSWVADSERYSVNTFESASAITVAT